MCYTFFIYTFHLWCPKPSFSCRFATNALGVITLTVQLQLFVYTILYTGNYFNFLDIILLIGLQILTAVTYALITIKRIKNGKFFGKKGNGSAVCTATIAGAASLGYSFLRILFKNMDKNIAMWIAVFIFTMLFMFLAILATFHMLKVYYAKKYQITCGEDGESISQMLVLPPKKKMSLAKRVLKAVRWGLLILVLIAILYGMYQASR